jgi:hypothetical protein
MKLFSFRLNNYTWAKLHSLSKYFGTMLWGRRFFKKLIPNPPIGLLGVAAEAEMDSLEVFSSLGGAVPVEEDPSLPPKPFFSLRREDFSPVSLLSVLTPPPFPLLLLEVAMLTAPEEEPPASKE